MAEALLFSARSPIDPLCVNCGQPRHEHYSGPGAKPCDFYCSRHDVPQVPEEPRQVVSRRSLGAELDALQTIVEGFEALPAEARGRAYSYLMSRYPSEKATR